YGHCSTVTRHCVRLCAVVDGSMVCSEERLDRDDSASQTPAWSARITRQVGADCAALRSSDPDWRSEPDISPPSRWRHFPRRRPPRGQLRTQGNGRDVKRSIRYSLGGVALANTLAAQGPGSLLGVSFAPSKGSFSLSV